MNMKLRIAIFMLGLMIAIVKISGQQPSQISDLFRQLQQIETTDQATEQLLKVAKEDPITKKYLAEHLPLLIERGTVHSPVWRNSVRLAGELKIPEAAAALGKWIGVDAGGFITKTTLLNLDNNPAAKALVKIGDPSIPVLNKILQSGSKKERTRAIYALRLIHSPVAKMALSQHVANEADSGLHDFIQQVLDKWEENW